MLKFGDIIYGICYLIYYILEYRKERKMRARHRVRRFLEATAVRHRTCNCVTFCKVISTPPLPPPIRKSVHGDSRYVTAFVQQQQQQQQQSLL